jgi:hypothetical protein
VRLGAGSVDWHSPLQIGSLDSENQNSTGPEATGDEHNPGADLCHCHALHLHRIFALIGDSLNPLADAVRRTDIEWIGPP